ncbi:MAG: FAD-dependent oxidoreductase, partial [Candidatus Binatia bacterium]
WWTDHNNLSSEVPFTVNHATELTTKNFNQKQGGGQWNLRGRYNFMTGTFGNVSVTDLNGRASADAVRFVPVP